MTNFRQQNEVTFLHDSAVDASALMEEAMASQARTAGAIYQHVWVRGSKGQLVPQPRHAKTLGVP